jgi:hypothetical protein
VREAIEGRLDAFREAFGNICYTLFSRQRTEAQAALLVAYTQDMMCGTFDI